jgi:hypothetical protein
MSKRGHHWLSTGARNLGNKPSEEKALVFDLSKLLLRGLRKLSFACPEDSLC